MEGKDSRDLFYIRRYALIFKESRSASPLFLKWMARLFPRPTCFDDAPFCYESKFSKLNPISSHLLRKSGFNCIKLSAIPGNQIALS